MKKKKDKKKEQMPEVAFKEYTPEEDRIYTEAVTRFREAIAAGTTLKEAYGSYSVADKELEALIQADFLKIMIAERHFSGKEPLEKVAKDLGVPEGLVKDTFGRMLQEVGISTANQFGKEHGSTAPDGPATND
jgi:adenine deaminase